MFKKKIITLLTILLVCFLVNPALTLASQDVGEVLEGNIVQPMWTYINAYRNTFDITTSGRADVSISLYAFEADSIRIQANLQQFKDGQWTTIRTWTRNSDSYYCLLNEAWYVMSGNYYRMVSTGTVYKNGRAVEQTSYTSPLHYY